MDKFNIFELDKVELENNEYEITSAILVDSVNIEHTYPEYANLDSVLETLEDNGYYINQKEELELIWNEDSSAILQTKQGEPLFSITEVA